jgi:hypothetical protein
MPTVLNIEGFRFSFSNEAGGPLHIQIGKGDGHAEIWLRPLELAHSWRFDAQKLRRARELCKENQTAFVQAWERYFV